MSEQVVTPYRKAKQEWDRRMGDSLVRAKAWRMVSMMLLGICMILILGMMYFASLPRRIPYIIELNASGEAVYKGDVGNQVYSLKEKVIRISPILFYYYDITR